MKDNKVFATNHFSTHYIKVLISALASFLLISAICFSAGAKATTVEVGIPVEEHPELFLPRSMPTHGEGKIVVFLIDFPDMRNNNPVATVEYYDSLYFKGGVASIWQTESVANFFYEQSYGKLNLSGKVFDWYTAKHERSYYTFDKKAELVMEVAEHFRAQGVDFSQFDGNNDGIIDAITYHFAGESTSYRDSDWYPGLYFTSSEPYGTIGSTKFTSFIQINECATSAPTKNIYAVCHELVHALGMYDLYSEVDSTVTPVHDIMCGVVEEINPYTKLLLGWIDNVKIITSNTNDIRLNASSINKAGDIAIVTNKFNGFFDEFYLVACRDGYPVVWHIDARLNGAKTAFLFDNLSYDPRPDKNNPHNPGNSSSYLFVEELSAHPDYDYVFNTTLFLSDIYFKEGSVLGPNTMPSSDTHDGGYTGIRMDDFKVPFPGEKTDKAYITFDVSFIEDRSAPTVKTKESDLTLADVITIKFNEHIYKGVNYNNIKVTDLKGNLLDATVILTHYPRNAIEIKFNDDANNKGYKIYFPKNSLQDSSKNGLAEVTLTCTADRHIFSNDSEKLPSVEGAARDNIRAFFFPNEKGMLVITLLWANDPVFGENIDSAKIEFMQLDHNGNYISQIIIDNPCLPNQIERIVETDDGNYIFFCVDNRNYYCSLIFSTDAKGNVRWINDTYLDSNVEFQSFQTVVSKNGLLVMQHSFDRNTLEYVFIDSNTGVIKPAVIEVNGRVVNIDKYTPKPVDLLNGKMLFTKEFNSTQNGQTYIVWGIADSQTYEIEFETRSLYEIGSSYYPRFAKANDNGTTFVYCSNGSNGYILLLDVNLNVIKSMPTMLNAIMPMDVGLSFWFEDGICDFSEVAGNHDNNQYYIRRYDSALNLVWEANLYVNFPYFFKTSDGELKAYISLYKPERECYIYSFGNENNLIKTHRHTLTYKEGTQATCLKGGIKESLYCTECGCCYTDQGKTLITDRAELLTPISDHSPQVIPGFDSTCLSTGVTDAIECSVCYKLLTEQKIIPQKDHTERIIPARAATCGRDGLTEGKKCSVCYTVLVAQKTIPATGHTEKALPAVAATCTASGLTEGKKCSVCNEILVAQKMIPANRHTEITLSAVAATCTAQGLTEGKKCSVCNAITVAQNTVPAVGHKEKIIPAVAPTTETVGSTEGKKCSICGTILVAPQTVPIIAPAVTEPAVTEPVVTEPVVTEPETTESEITEPVATEPETTELEITEPVATESETTEPVETEFITTEPIQNETEKVSDSGCSAAISAILVPIMIIGAAISVKKKD